MSAPTPSFQPVDFSRILAYRHPRLVVRLQQKLCIKEQEAQDLFDDLKRFLFLCATHAARLGPTDRIDEAWHNFILFTKDYRAFCAEFLGTFVEHVPLSEEDRAVQDGSMMRLTFRAAQEVFGENLSANWRYRTPEASSCVSDCTKCTGSTNCEADDS